MSRLVTLYQAQEIKIQHISELLQAYEMALHTLTHSKPGTDPFKEASKYLHGSKRAWSRTLTAMIDEFFNVPELQSLVYDLGWNYEELKGDHKSQTVRKYR
jgi:hypothetical protein